MGFLQQHVTTHKLHTATASPTLYSSLNDKKFNNDNVEVQLSPQKPEAADHDLRTAVVKGLDAARAAFLESMANATSKLMRSSTWANERDDALEAVQLARRAGRLFVVFVTKDRDFHAHVEDVLRAGQRAVIVLIPGPGGLPRYAAARAGIADLAGNHTQGTNHTGAVGRTPGSH